MNESGDEFFWSMPKYKIVIILTNLNKSYFSSIGHMHI